MADEGDARKTLLQSIMKTDVYSLRYDATVEDAMHLFIEKNISAAPIIGEAGEPVGFISGRRHPETSLLADGLVRRPRRAHRQLGAR